MSTLSEQPPRAAGNPFERAYLAYQQALKEAWAEVDIDEMVSANREDPGASFSTAGSAGTFGTWGTAPATIGSLGSFGCFGTLGPVIDPQQSAAADQQPAQPPVDYGSTGERAT
jgi:hypothetical protein